MRSTPERAHGPRASAGARASGAPLATVGSASPARGGRLGSRGGGLRYEGPRRARSATVAPIHDKAMPVMLMTAQDVDVWLNGTLEEALKLQKRQPDDALVITPYDE